MLQLDQDVEKGVLFWGYSPPNISWVTPSGGTIHRCIGASRYASCIDTHDGSIDMMNASIQIRLFVFVTFFNPVYKVTFSERDFDWMTLDW